MDGKKKVVVVPYRKDWVESFYSFQAYFGQLLEGLILDIQHVGSTSVIGLAAKPIIDIDLIVKDRQALFPVIEKLESVGYRHVGDMGVPDREAFKYDNDRVPYTPENKTWPVHNLYVCPLGSISLKNHLTLRDYLRAHPDKASDYGLLKMQLAEQHPYDIDAYIAGKTTFITAILSEAGFERETLKDIIQINQGSEEE